MLGVITLVALCFGKVAFYSALLGALLVIVPHAYFAWRVFRFRGAKYTRNILKDFYMGETLKLVMTFSGFAIIFAMVHPLSALALFITFIIGQLLFWFAPILLKKAVMAK